MVALPANKGPLIVTSTAGAPTFRPLQAGAPFRHDEVTGLASPKGPPSSAGNYSTEQVSGTAGIDDLDTP